MFVHQMCQLTCNTCYVGRLGTRHPIASPTTRPSNMYTLLPASWPSETHSVYPSKVPSVGFTHIPASLSHLAPNTSSGSPSGRSEIHPSAIPSYLPSVASSGFTSNVAPILFQVPLNSPSIFPSKLPLNKESRTPTLMLNSESPYPEDNIFHSAPNEETLQSQKCEDDPTFFDNLGNSCSDYNTLGCSGLSYEKCPFSCGRCEVNTRTVHASGSDLPGLSSTYKISWFVGAGVAVLILLSAVSCLVVRKQKLRTRGSDQASVDDVVSINLIELCSSIEMEYLGE